MGTYEVGEISTNDMSRLMVGREVVLTFEKDPPRLQKTMLEVKDLVAYNAQGVQKVQNLSFEVRGGEILGIAGVEGNGQTELVDVLTGLSGRYTGTILLKGEDIREERVFAVSGKRSLHISRRIGWRPAVRHI